MVNGVEATVDAVEDLFPWNQFRLLVVADHERSPGRVMELQALPLDPQPTEGSDGRASILIAEDEPLAAEYVASVAHAQGFAAKAVETAPEFGKALMGVQPDVIVTDLAMPGGDGVELMRKLAEYGYRGPVLILSSCDERTIDSSARLGREMGLNIVGSAQKPISSAQLKAMLDRAREEISRGSVTRPEAVAT